MKKICAIIILFFILTNLSIVYGYTQVIYLNTLKIENITNSSNVYLLVKSDLYNQNQLNVNYYDNVSNLISKINKGAIYIKDFDTISKLSDIFQNTNETVELDNSTYVKIKVLKNTSVAWCGNTVLISNILDNHTNLINMNDISQSYYHDCTPSDYSGNEVYRKAMVYDATNNSLIDITQNKVGEEIEILNKIKDRNKVIEKYRPIILVGSIIIAIIVAILAGKLIDFLVKKVKK